MWTFQYKNGDRPLDGFTIQRAAGRGGFGEVYYALSDSGREVALKAVQGYEQIELRGISQCMNLKSPHLVTIFDVKFNDLGKPFVIMEFVSGPSLRQLLDEAPAGLGTQKSAFFLREIAKGLTFLHECGIVHRDLKPGNIFFENGYVKIGDYGLSKAISPTQHSGQTVTVGTVHYMAPEVGIGKYDRSIDIYAMGAVLYEMLTGTVPFIGASPSEILMKHLQAEPDMSGVPEPFNTVIRKAMAKDPSQRYQSIQEMVEGVFGTEHVRMSVSCFSPDDLSMVAGRVAEKVALGGGGIGGGNSVGSSSVVGGADDIAGTVRDRLAQMRDNLQDRRDELRESLQDKAQRIRDRFGIGGIENDQAIPPIPPAPTPSNAINDSLSVSTRWFLGLLTALVVAIATGLVEPDMRTRGRLSSPLPIDFFVFNAILGATIGIIVGWRKIAIPKLRQESHSVRKLVVGLIVCATTLIASGMFWLILTHVGRYENGTLVAVLAPLTLMNTWEWARANRKERVSLGPAIGIGFIGFILSGIFSGNPLLAIAVLSGTCLMVQVTAPWDPELASNRRAKAGSSPDSPTTIYGNATVTSKQAEAMRAAGVKVYGNLNVVDTPESSRTKISLRSTYTAPPTHRPVPAFAPYIWLGLFIALFTTGLMCLIAVGTNAIHGNEQPPFVALGVSALVTALFCFVRIFKKRFHGWWSYLIRPMLMLACISTILTSSIVLGNANLHEGDALVAIFFIVFPSLILLTLPFLPRRFGPPPLPKNGAGQDSPHTRGIALGMSVLGFCGAAGIQRFYVGKIGTGILWLLTGGLFGIGQIIDIILICTGQFTDSEGRVLRYWDLPSDFRSRQIAPQAFSPAPSAAPMSPISEPSQAAPIQDGPTPTVPSNPAPDYPGAPYVPPVPAAPIPTIVFPPRERSTSGGILSVITAFLVMLLVVVSLAIGFDAPLAVVSGLPDAQTSQEIRNALFHDSQLWQTIVTQLLWVAMVVLGLVTVGMMMAARRRTTMLHILRGILGIGGLLCAVAMLTSTFHKNQGWIDIGQQVNAHNSDAAIQAFFRHFTDGHPIAAAGICLASFLLMAIPSHRRLTADRELA